MNILICDDEKPFLGRLANKITVYLKNREIPFQMATSCSEEELPKHNEGGLLDIALLDIGMNAVSRVNAAKYFRDRNRKIYTVFVAGYMDYVLEDCKVEAFHYLVKDFLEISFEKCMRAMPKRFHIDTDEIHLEFTDRKLHLKADEICLVGSRGHKLLFLAVDDGHIIGTTNRKLTDVEGLLGGHGFLRVHQSYMVSMEYIVDTASYRLELESDIILHVPRNRYPYVKWEYTIYKGDNL